MTRMLWGAVGVLLLVTPVHAAESVRTVRDVTAIVDGSGVGRLLFKVDLPAELGPVAVKQAIVTVPLRALEGYPEGGALDLRLHPVARSWEPGCTSSGWSWGRSWSTRGSSST